MKNISSPNITDQVVLVTGGAGYIGSHTVVALVQSGFQPVVFDNFTNSSEAVFPRLEMLCGRPVPYVTGDVRDIGLLRRTIEKYNVRAVIHFAGFKAVGESVAEPLRYYDNNVNGLLALLSALNGTAARSIVFSSSATVYGEPDRCPIPESAAVRPTNPYGHSKAMCERILQSVCAADTTLHVAVLRYFNPAGAHESGLIGEDPAGIPNNLMPYLSQVAAGQREKLSVFGSDYATADGTGVRDYIHVVDLAKGHLAALQYLANHAGATFVNLGTGTPCSVLELIDAFTRESGKAVPYIFAPRRPGDIAECWADPSLAKHRLGWQAQLGVPAMCVDAWRWQKRNPHGYR